MLFAMLMFHMLMFMLEAPFLCASRAVLCVFHVFERVLRYYRYIVMPRAMFMPAPCRDVLDDVLLPIIIVY